MWTPARKEIVQICQQFNIQQDKFYPVPINEWQEIQEKIFQQFCYPDRNGQVWERLKGDSSSVQFNYNYPFDQLPKLVDHSEKVWLILEETISEKAKHWFYEGYITDIVSVLEKCNLTEEVYIASKKYEWLLCVNHRDCIIATGSRMFEKSIAKL